MQKFFLFKEARSIDHLHAVEQVTRAPRVFSLGDACCHKAPIRPPQVDRLADGYDYESIKQPSKSIPTNSHRL